MKRRLRRNVKGTTEKDEDDNSSTYSSPGKEKENLSPSSSRGRSSMDTHHHQFITLLKDFDQNVAMTKKDILTNYQVLTEELTLPFHVALTKLPSQIKVMKWGDYLEMKKNQSTAAAVVPVPGSEEDANTFLVPGSSKQSFKTPAVRGKLAKNKLPIITPKFDPSTPASAISKRLPKPGEMLLSMKGSPVSNPSQTPLSIRGSSALASSEDLIALLSNKETLANALKDKNACEAIVNAYSTVKKMKD